MTTTRMFYRGTYTRTTNHVDANGELVLDDKGQPKPATITETYYRVDLVDARETMLGVKAHLEEHFVSGVLEAVSGDTTQWGTIDAATIALLDADDESTYSEEF